MKTIFVLALLLGMIFTAIVPSKKRRQSGRRRPKRRANAEPELRLFPEFFPLIFQYIFDGLKTNRTFKNPLKQYRLVSKYWCKCLDDDVMRQVMMSHPKTAAILVKKYFRTDGPFYFSLLLTGKPYLQGTLCARKLLVNAKNISVFQVLSKFTGLSDCALSDQAYATLLTEAHANGSLTAPLVYDYLFPDPKRSALRDHIALTLHSEYSLHKIPTPQILLLCFLEDMLNPFDYSFIFEYIARQTMHAYRNGDGADLKFLMIALNQTDLPRMISTAMYATFSYVMLVAAMIGDIELLSFFDMDYEATRRIDITSVPIVDLIESVHRGREPFFPHKDLALALHLLTIRTYANDYGFDRELLKARCKAIIDDNHVSGNIKVAIMDSIFSKL